RSPALPRRARPPAGTGRPAGAAYPVPPGAGGVRGVGSGAAGAGARRGRPAAGRAVPGPARRVRTGHRAGHGRGPVGRRPPARVVVLAARAPGGPGLLGPAGTAHLRREL
ncbi:MAG: hypothetical protein AVDCRST_MAG66-3740, partial [uncultured Pseudonocardia sp.]